MKAMNILLINITRFGDTLQAQPLLHALHAHYLKQGIQAKIGLVCVENFVNAGQLLMHVSDIFPLPSSYFLKNLNNTKGSWLKALNSFEVFTNTIINSFNPDVIINLTPSVVARLLSKKISLLLEEKSKKINVYGFALDDFGFSLDTTIWASYIQAVTMNRLSSPFNLSDGFTLLGGLELLEERNPSSYASILKDKHAQNPSIRPSTKKEEQEAHTILSAPLNTISRDLLSLAHKNTQNMPKQSFSPPPNNSSHAYIAFQLGASAQKRQYSIEHFATLSNLLNARGYTIVLLGSQKEEELVEKFYLAKGVGINLVGKTDLTVLPAVLSACKLIITNDTGTMHLAASVNIPILALFLATAQAWDTGPISVDACLIEPNMSCHPCSFTHKCTKNYACKSAIDPQILADIAEVRLTTNEWQQYFSAKTRIWKSQRDENGFLVLKALDIVDKNSREALYLMQRSVYKNALEFLATKKKSIEISISPYLDKREKECLLATLSALCDLYVLLQQQAKLMGNLEKMKHGFLSTNQKIISLFKSNASTLPLVYLWEYAMQTDSLEGNSLTEIMQKFETILNTWKDALNNNVR